MTARVVVVGAGVSGLTAAFRLRQLDPSLDVTVLEAGARPGGKLTSITVGDLELPAGADSFVARKPWAVELCHELGIGGELIAPAASGAFLWTEHGLVPFLPETAFGIPGDVGDVLRWPGLSRAGRRRALGDLVRRKRRDPGDETLGSLLRRRLGDEATDLAVGPLLAGLFAGDIDRLSAQATFPDLVRWESWQGSLIRGAQAARREARRGEPGPMFLRPRAGVQRLTDELARDLGERVHTGHLVERIARQDSAWRIVVGGKGPQHADAVVIATEAHVSRQLLHGVARRSADELDAIPSVSTAVVLMVYPPGTADALPDGSGFVVPAGRAPMTACTWLSSKWPDEAFGTRAVVRCFVGSAGADDVVDADDADLIEACARHFAALVELPDAPEHAAVVRWPRAMPQYELGHLDRVERLRRHLPAGIFVTGQPYDGVGVPDCVRAAGATAEMVVAHLHRSTRPTLEAPDRDEETV